MLDNNYMNQTPCIAQTLRHLMNCYNKGLGISENALSRATYEMFGDENGVPQPTIHRILTGTSKDPKSHTIRRLAKFFGITEAQLRGSATLPNQLQPSDGDSSYLVPLPILSWEQAYNAGFILDEIRQGMIDVPFERTQRVSQKAFTLTVQGDAMHGSGQFTFPEGVSIVVDPAIEAEHGSFIVATASGYPNPIFRRLEIEGGIYRLIPLNERPGYEIITLTPHDRIIGKVIKYYCLLP